MNSHPFYLTLTAVSGDPNGLRVVEHSSWFGKALICPRNLVPEVIHHRDEFSKSAVYFLLGPNEEGTGEKLYIGEADPLRERVQNHLANKEFWTRLIFFTGSSDQLNKTHVKFLESSLVNLARNAKRVEIENKTNPSQPSMSESERIKGEGFLRHILETLPILGVHAFEVPKKSLVPTNSLGAIEPPPMTVASDLVLRSKGITARGYDSNDGFVVRVDSQALKEVQPSMANHVNGYYLLRNDLVENGVLCDSGSCFVFSQDYPFASPSAAAAVILGRSANGLIEWQDATGTSLKAIQMKKSQGGLE